MGFKEYAESFPEWKDVSLTEAVSDFKKSLDEETHMLGIPEVDSLLSGELLNDGKIYKGLSYGSTITISALPGFGKTHLMSVMAKSFLDRGEHVLFMGMEMGTEATSGYLAKIGIESSPFFHAPKEVVLHSWDWLKLGVESYLEAGIPLKLVVIDHWHCLVDVSALGVSGLSKQTLEIVTWFRKRKISLIIAIHETRGATEDAGEHFATSGLNHTSDIVMRLFNKYHKDEDYTERQLTVSKNRRYGKVKTFKDFKTSQGMI